MSTTSLFIAKLAAAYAVLVLSVAAQSSSAPAEVNANPRDPVVSKHAWDGSGFVWPGEERSGGEETEVSVAKIKLPAGEPTPWHCHPYTTVGYVLSGVLEITNGDKTVRFYPGDSVFETARQPHRGQALDSDVELIVMRVGVADEPNTLVVDSPDAKCY
ncbi:MAG: cupin domain-containing protein [Pseudomonadota bacterium]